VTKFCLYASTVAFCSLLIGCGGASSTTATPTDAGFSAANIQGQYQVIAKSSMNPGGVLFVEANFTQTGSDAFAGQPSVILIQGTQNSAGITLTGLGGECDNGVTGGDSIQATFYSSTKLSFNLTESGVLGSGSTTGTVTFSPDGSQIVAGTYMTPAACGFVADSGTLTGTVIHPFSGSYAGMLANVQGTTDAVIVTVSQNAFDLSVSGTDNGTQFLLKGSTVGATFNVSGTIAGQAVQYVGVFDAVGNDFLVYDASLSFLGTLKNGTNPQSVFKVKGLLKTTR
jgi:hypothetical protein